MGASFWDLDETTRARLLEANPELAAELGVGKAAAAEKTVEVDPEVQRLLDLAERNKQAALDLMAHTQLVNAETRLLVAQTQLRTARLKQQSAPRRSGRHHGGGLIHPPFWVGWLFLAVVVLMVV